MIQFTLSIVLDDGLVLSRQQAIAWINVDPVPWRHMVLPGLNQWKFIVFQEKWHFVMKYMYDKKQHTICIYILFVFNLTLVEPSAKNSSQTFQRLYLFIMSPYHRQPSSSLEI